MNEIGNGAAIEEGNGIFEARNVICWKTLCGRVSIQFVRAPSWR
jgi:hypothetical protein